MDKNTIVSSGGITLASHTTRTLLQELAKIILDDMLHRLLPACRGLK